LVGLNWEFLTIKEAAMMRRILHNMMLVCAVSMLVGAPMLNGVALAGHIRDAVQHAKAAVSHGKEGHAEVCVEHAQTALDNAKGAKVKSPHLDEGVKHLMEAIKHGQAGHADACTEHADLAVTHLAEVKEK
jgi:hypothetical protein